MTRECVTVRGPIGGIDGNCTSSAFAVKEVLSPWECRPEWCGESSNEGPNDEAGLGGALCDCPTIGPRGQTSVLPDPNGKSGSLDLLGSRLA